MSFSWSSLLLEHEFFLLSLPYVLCWGVADQKKAKREKERGRLGKAKKNQYMSDKKAQILDGSSVWVWGERRSDEREKGKQFYSSLPILKDLWETSYVFNSWQKRKQNEGIFSSFRRKLNWKFSIIYIWGKRAFPSFSIHPLTPLAFSKYFSAKKFWWRWSSGKKRTTRGREMTVLCCNKFSQYTKKKNPYFSSGWRKERS